MQYIVCGVCFLFFSNLQPLRHKKMAHLISPLLLYFRIASAVASLYISIYCIVVMMVYCTVYTK